jgi:P27 family predicted phage terminase small subunit
MTTMGKRGPAPAPTALRTLYGVRPDRINNSEPVPSPGPVQPPEWLSPDARAVWDGLAADLENRGVLTAWDAEVFACCCDAAARRRRAVAHLASEGEVLELPVMDHGRVVATRVARNPWTLVLADADGQLQRYAARFGLTPSDRAQLKTQQPVHEPGWDLLS